MTRPANPSAVAASSPATSSWANSVVDAVVAICNDIYGVTALAIPWASLTGVPASFTPAAHTHADASHGGTVAYAVLTGKPATFAPTLAAAVAATTYGLAKVDGVSASGAHADHVHGTPALPTPTQVGSVAAFDTPATGDGGKRLYVGSSTPTGASEGDVWIKG